MANMQESEVRSAGIPEDGNGELTLGETTLGRKHDQIPSTDQTVNPSDMEQDQYMAAKQRPEITVSMKQSEATEGFDFTDVKGSMPGPSSEEQTARELAADNKLGDVQATKSSDTEKMPVKESCSTTFGIEHDARTGSSADGSDSSVQQGVRTFDQETRAHLNSMYKGDWKKPQTTYIVGDVPPGTSNNKGTLAEWRILKLLEDVGRKRKEPMFVVHSFSFNELKKYVTHGGQPVKENIHGEHDIVIIHHKYGVIFIQVKAKKATRKEFDKAEKQLCKDLESLKIFVEHSLDESGKKCQSAGKALYKHPFVAMPNCSKVKAGERRGLFEEDCKDISTFEGWWKENVEGLTVEGFTQEVFERLVIRFVGMSERFSTCLSHRIDNTQKKIDAATNEVLEPFLKSFCAVTWITGATGTGKTWLLTRKARELARTGGTKGILFVCHNSSAEVRQTEFKKYIEEGTVQVQTYQQFLSNVKESNIQGQPKPLYQHIFVDEAQDCVNEDLQGLFEQHLREDVGRQYLWLAYDPNECLTGPASATVQKQIAQSCSLKKVVGSSERIFDLFRKYFHSADSGQLTHVGSAGLDVVWTNSLTDTSDKGELVADQVNILLEENVKQKDICVLVENEEEKTELVGKLEFNKVPCVGSGNQDKGGIIVETIENFSTQKSKVVILLDPPTSVDERSTRRLLYIGISRCSCYLVVISSTDGSKALKDACTENAPSMV